MMPMSGKKYLQATGKPNLEVPFFVLAVYVKQVLYFLYTAAQIHSFIRLIHELDKVLTPPGMVTQLGYLKGYTSINVSTLQDLLLASNWDTSNLSKSLLATTDESQRFTLFAPTDSFFNESGSVVVDRLFRPEYARHLENLLKSLLLPREYSLDEIVVSTDLQRGIQNMQTLSGFNQTISSLGGLSIGDAGSFLEPSLRGIDGYVVNSSYALL